MTITDETPIEVAFVTEEAAPPPPKQEKKPEPIEDIPPPLEKKPQPAPKALEQPKPEIKKAEEAKEKIPEPDPEPLPEPEKPKVKPKPPEPPKKVEKKPEPVPENPPQEETTPDFMSVLKNLQDSDPATTQDTAQNQDQENDPAPDPMTRGELDAFRMQLSQCWNILPGAAQAETLAVNLTITVNRDRTVRNVQVVDRARYQSDAFFRAAADNAIRAIKHPDCTPLDLPQDKYTMWKEIKLNFDPRTMF